MSTKEETDYSLDKPTPNAKIAAPDLPYKPAKPKTYRPRIGMIGTGGITETHCKAYTKSGYEVVAMCDLIVERAEKRSAKFYPKADVYTDYRKVLERTDIDVVDIATHPADRLPLIEAALQAGKHVLSQKPFVLDLDTGERLVQLAESKGVKFAVNQNGRWSPHFAYIRHAVREGLIGELTSMHFGVHWDHTWVQGTPFEKIFDVILYDFSIHWFDIGSHLLGDKQINSVIASRSYCAGQTIEPPMMAQAMISFEGGQGSFIFDAHLPYGSLDRTYIGGTKGAILSTGVNLGGQELSVFTAKGVATPKLEGHWFPDGFSGTMGELLCAIEENREPINSAKDNLRSLALCFAAIASANDGIPKVPGTVRRLPKGCAPGADD